MHIEAKGCAFEQRTHTTLDGVPQVLSSMALHVVGHAHLFGLLISQHLHTTSGLPVELHVGLLASLVHHLEGVDSKALHVTPVSWDTTGSQKPHQLQWQAPRSRMEMQLKNS